MWYLYVDESGDLGFDFFAKSPSKYFTVCLLLVRGSEHNRAILSAVKKTVRRKLPPKDTSELKGARTSFEVKQYFYRIVQEIPFAGQGGNGFQCGDGDADPLVAE